MTAGDGVVRVAVVGGDAVRVATEPLVRADDFGFTRGDGCFDATIAHRGPDGRVQVGDLDAHLARLARSAAALSIQLPERSAWLATLDAMLAQWPGDDGVVKFVATRGPEHAPGLGPTALILLADTDPGTIEQRHGVRVTTLGRGMPSDAFVEAPWLLGGVKTLSYAVNMAARREAARRGAHDALFVSTDGYALEAPTAGLVWYVGGILGTTTTVGTGVLASVTVERARDGALAAGLQWQAGLLPVDDLYDADGLWLCSSGRGVAPILELDGRAVRVHRKMTHQLRDWTGFGWVN